MPPRLLDRLVAPFFVFLWSTGFIAARYGVPYAEPTTFLTLRFGLVLAVMVPAVAIMRARIRWPVRNQVMHIAIAGALLHGAYLLGVFEAVGHGMGAGTVALIVGVQPILTALAAGFVMRERVLGRQWIGLGLGLLGVILVVWDRLSFAGITGPSMMYALGALAGITTGTIYQKRFCPSFDLRAGSVIQFTAAFVALLPFTVWMGPGTIEWTVPLIGALLWSVLAMSIGAISLLFILIRRGPARGAATQVAGLMYLTPAVTALMAWVLFDERITPVMVAGMIATALGVALIVAVVRQGDRSARPGAALPAHSAGVAVVGPRESAEEALR